ncbi:MAG: nitroreductase family protein [Pirellulales bacterium]|nr:nitroreductase family protein [Pirellulales bacterium]
MTKTANTDHPILDLHARRYSPYAYSDQPVTDVELQSLFEAARWAPSSYNEQPWFYIAARKEDAQQHEQVLSCLVDGNQAWASHVPVLVLGCYCRHFTRNGNPNKCAQHDLGLASMALTVEATHRNLFVHQMAGILPDKAREIFQIPDDYEALTGLAIGHLGDGTDLPEAIRSRDSGERGRKPQSEFVFGGTWGQAAPWLS